MKYAYAVVALAAGAYAQSLSDLPACALPAIDAARKSATDCSETDYKCICANMEKLTGVAVDGVIKGCGAAAATAEVLPAVQKFCAAVAAGGGAASSPASSAAAPSSSSAVASPTGYATPSSSSKAASPTPYPTGGNATTTSKPAPSSSIQSAGAAIAGSIGGIGMFVLGALAAF